jgi:predicted RNA polymerase sigma factor
MHKVETFEWLKMLSRMIRAAGRRVADSDEHELSCLAELQREFDAAMQAAVDGQIASGRSWAHIGKALGISKQAAFKRFGRSKSYSGFTSTPYEAPQCQAH